MLEEGCYLTIYDPKVNSGQIKKELNNLKKNQYDVEYHSWNKSEDLYKTFLNVDTIIILTDWIEFGNLDLKDIFNYEISRMDF